MSARQSTAAAKKRATEGCALFWYDLLFMTLPSSCGNNNKNNMSSKRPVAFSSSSSSQSEMEQIQERWWPSSAPASESWKPQADAITVARVAVTMMCPEAVWQSCGAVMRSSGFTFPSSSSNSSSSSSSSGNSSSSSSSLLVRVPAQHLVTALELLCRRYTDEAASEQERKDVRFAFWRTAAFVSFRVVELDPPDVARALSVICEVPPVGGWDAPVMHRVNDHRSGVSAPVTPRGICAYLSCQARLRARRFSAIFSLHALSAVGAQESMSFQQLNNNNNNNNNNSSSTQGEQNDGGASLCDPRDIQILQKKVIHDTRGKWRPIVAQTLEESCSVMGRSSSSNFREVLQFASEKEQSSSAAPSCTLPWALLPANSLSGLSWKEEQQQQQHQQQQQSRSVSPEPKHRGHSQSTAKSVRKEAAVDVSVERDIVGRALLRQLVFRKPVEPSMMHRGIMSRNAAASLPRRSRFPLTVSVKELNQRDQQQNSSNGSSTPKFGPTQRRRALIQRAEQLLMFQPTLLTLNGNSNSSSSSSPQHFGSLSTRQQIVTARTHMATRYDKKKQHQKKQQQQQQHQPPQQHQQHQTSKKSSLIWSTVGAWSDVFRQLSPQAKSAITSASLATLRGSGNSDPHTLRAVAESGCSQLVVPEFQRSISRAALQGLVGYRQLAGKLLHFSAALSKTINGLGAVDIVPRLALATSIPRETLAMCVSRVVGGSSTEDVVPCFELHTQSVVSPSAPLLALLKIVSEFNCGDEQFRNNVRALSGGESGGGGGKEDDAELIDTRKLRKQVVLASCKLLLDAINDVRGGPIDDGDEGTATAAAARHFLGRVSAIPVLVASALGGNSNLQPLTVSLIKESTAANNGDDDASASAQDHLQTTAVRCMKLALFQCALLAPRFDAVATPLSKIKTLALAEEGRVTDENNLFLSDWIFRLEQQNGNSSSSSSIANDGAKSLRQRSGHVSSSAAAAHLAATLVMDTRRKEEATDFSSDLHQAQRDIVCVGASACVSSTTGSGGGSGNSDKVVQKTLAALGIV